jgi:hypothetical protein
VNVDPAAAAAVSVTDAPPLKDAEQVEPQLIPAGELVTVPDPAPAGVTVSVCGTAANVAVTLRAAVMLTVQVVVLPVQSPDQLVNVDPAPGAAVRVTDVPLLKDAEHVEPQLIPAGELVTEPEPVPASATDRVCCTIPNVAVTLRAAVMLTVQVVDEPEQAPDQEVNVEPAAGAAVRVTDVPLL